MRSIAWKQLLLSSGIVAIVLWRVPLGGLRAAFRGLETGSLLLSLVCLGAWFALRAYKWHHLMAVAGNARISYSLRNLLGGFALGLVTPGRLGELGRCVFVRQPERAQVALLTVFDRALDFWALLTSMGAGLFLVVSRPAAIFGVAVWLALLPLVMGFPALIGEVAKLARTSRYFRGHVLQAAAGISQIPTPRFALLAVGAMAAELVAFFFLLRAFSPTGFATTLATYPYIVLAADLPVSFSGVGVREGVAALLLSPYAVPRGAAVGACLLWFVFTILLPAIFGAVWLLADRLRARMRAGDAVAIETGSAYFPNASSNSLSSARNFSGSRT